MMKERLIAIILCVVGTALMAHPDPRVQKIHEHFGNQPLWSQEGKWTHCAEAFFDVLGRVEQDGLWPDTYASANDLRTGLVTPEADFALTALALTYIGEMKGRRLNPHAVDSNIHEKPPEFDESAFLIRHLATPHYCGWPETVAPEHEEYQELKELLVRYRQKKEEGGWPQLPQGTTLAPGAMGPLVQTLKQQLNAQDVSVPESGDVFDDTVEDAVKRYQNLHGIEPTGTVGPETLKALNTSVEDRIESIIVSLERHRWLPSPLPARYIQVNIPGFYLKAVGEDGTFFMPIITGKEYRKTPVFDDSITSIIFNPSWHVPHSIAVRDKLPKLQRNPHALAAKGYKFYTASGEPLSPDSVSWGRYSSRNFPVRIVQSPGSANALGKIRFTLNNSFSIYMHGTPDKHLFHKTNRALSSGCIRVKDPAKLAAFVLNDAEEWSLEKINKATEGTTTRRVPLEQPLPVFVTYFTVFKDANGWHMVPDNYKQDSKVFAALEKAK